MERMPRRLRVARTSSPPCLFALFALALLALPALAQSSQPVTGAVASYDIALDEGDNIVSLPVVPDTSAVELVIAQILEELTLVQDDVGRYFVPAQEIADLQDWSWEEAYSVKVSAPTTLTVEGAEIVPEASPIPLEAEVGNWVPYLPNRPLPVAVAFASIADRLFKVEDSAGRLYQPGNEASTLDTLHVGRGYRVWVSEPTALVYPANDSSDGGGGGDVTVVSTLSQALALTGLEEGQEIEILGYYAPGDGGGGRFRVEASGATPDGGLAFAPSEHASGPVTETWRFSSDERYFDTLPMGQDVVYGSLSLELLHPDSGDVLFAVDGRHLHGHEWVTRFSAKPLVDYAEGHLHDRRHRLAKECERQTGSLWSCDMRLTYRHTTSDLRLQRVGVGSTLNAHWFGARPHHDDPTFDNQPVLCHVINVANERNAATPGTVSDLLLPEPAVYEYFGSVQLGDGLTLRGAGGTELTTVTNDLGHTYQPVRVKSAHTSLRVKEGEALRHIRMDKEPEEPHYLEPDVKQIFHNRKTAINLQPGATSAGLEDIVLDGNWEGNRQAWTEGWASHQEKEKAMRNTPGWSGFISTNHGGVYIPQGQQVTLRNVAILGYGATGVLGNVNNTWDAENVRLGNSLWNHSLYATNGTWTNLTFEGFAWAQAAWYVGEIENLVYEHGAMAPYRPNGGLLTIRGGDVSSQDEAGTLGGAFIQEDGTPLQLGTTVEGFYLDLRGSDISSPFAGLGPEIAIRNGTIVTRADGFQGVFHENGNGYQDGLYPNYRVEDVVVYDHADLDNSKVFGRLNTTTGLFRNVTKTPDLLEIDGTASNALELHANRRDDPAWDEPQVNVYDGIQSDTPHRWVADVSINGSSAGADYFVLNSRFNNTTSTIYRCSNGQGTLESLGGDPSKLRVYMENTELRINAYYHQNLEAFFALTYFSNVTDTRNDRTSEDGGTYPSTAADRGRSFVLIPTDLLWEPHPEDGTVSVSDDAGGIVSGIAFTDAEGNALGDDKGSPHLRVNLSRPIGSSETVSFSWEAAVRPWPEGVTLPAYAQ